MKREVALLEGDGIGPEIAEAVVLILEKAGAEISWKPCVAGLPALESHGDPLPEETLQIIKETTVALKGPITTPVGKNPRDGKNFQSVNVRLRKALDLYANVRPIKSLPAVKTRFENVDIVVIRENTEGLYAGLEQEIVPGVVTSLKVATRVACLRIAQFAFSYAEKHQRKKVTAVHKANIMKLSDGLALECYQAIATQYPEIAYEERIVDATAMELVLRPEKFDVLVMENLYGDILSDLGAGLIGGLGLAPSANVGLQGAVFEAVHGSAPDIAGKGIANPTALLLSSVMLLHHLGQHQVADRVEKACMSSLEAKKAITADLGGKAKTMEFANDIIARLS